MWVGQASSASAQIVSASLFLFGYRVFIQLVDGLSFVLLDKTTPRFQGFIELFAPVTFAHDIPYEQVHEFMSTST